MMTKFFMHHTSIKPKLEVCTACIDIIFRMLNLFFQSTGDNSSETDRVCESVLTNLM